MAQKGDRNGENEPVVGERGSGPRPLFRPRVVVKFHDWVDVSYADGAETEVFERYGPGPLEELAQRGEIRLIRLYTALEPDELMQLVKEAANRDQSYKPHNFLRWFTVDAPRGMGSEDLAALLRRWEIVEQAEPDAPAVDPVAPADDPRSPNQGYLDPAPDGIDAEFAWGRPGGDGMGQRVVDLEQGWTLNHEDLVGHGATLLFGTLQNGSRPHGTSVLGEICSVDNSVGCVGIATSVASVGVTSHSGSLANVPDAITAALPSMTFGDTLLLEVQTVTPAAPVFGAPIELIDASFESIRLATALGVIVVEAAGHGTNNLDTVLNSTGRQVLNPASADFRDSGAIIVGAASSTAPHTRMGFSSFGARVDCYAWGQNVDTPTSTSTSPFSTTAYSMTFNGTSSASPIITGAVLIVQGIVEAAGGGRLGPAQMRQVLSDPATGTASANPATDLIGVMPDLRAIIEDTLDAAGLPDAYIRDNTADVGAPHTGSISSSPDVIVRPTTVANPQSAYGEGSGTENSTTLGYEVEAGQDNFIYTRVRNRGAVASTATRVTVYWSEVATLITPDMWNLVGTTVIPTVPTGDLLTVADAIVWSSGDIPATGHYCFVALVDAPNDPAPQLAALVNFDNFRTFIRNNNNATWRNFNVVNTVPDPADPGVLMPFLVGGALDRALAMGLDVVARLPEGARLTLEAPACLLERLGFSVGQMERDKDVARIPLRPHGRQSLGVIRFPAKFKARLRLIVELPKEAQEQTGHSVTVRQYLKETGEELGRVTWYLAAPDWFERRKRVEKCLFDQ
jgi:serine protease